MLKSSNSAELLILESLRSVFAFNKLKEFLYQDLTPRQQKLLEELVHKKKHSNHLMKVGEIKIVGKKESTNKLTSGHNWALRRLNIKIDDNSYVKYYKRIIVNKELIHSKPYTKVRKRNSYSVLLSGGEIFEIDIFLVVKIHQEAVCFAIGNYLEKCQNTYFPGRRLQHLIFTKLLTASQPLAAIDAKITMVVEPINKHCLACVHPNKFEMLT